MQLLTLKTIFVNTANIHLLFTTDDLKAFVSLPSAGKLVGGCGVDIILLLVLLCVEGLVAVDVSLRGMEVMMEVLCCIVVVVAGVVVCVSWRDVMFVTSVIRRHWGSLLWKNKHQ